MAGGTGATIEGVATLRCKGKNSASEACVLEFISETAFADETAEKDDEGTRETIDMEGRLGLTSICLLVTTGGVMTGSTTRLCSIYYIRIMRKKQNQF